MTMSEFIIV